MQRKRESEKDAGEGIADEGEDQGQDLKNGPTFEGAPSGCDVEILMAPGGKPSCLTTLPAVRHCQSQCEPTDSQTHLQSGGGLRCS